MNHRSPSLFLSKAMNGFLQYKMAEGLSPATTASYERILRQWLDIKGDKNTSDVTSQDLREYMTYMRTEYKPQQVIGKKSDRLSSKSLRNIYVALSAFWHWASDEFEFANPMKAVPSPRYTLPEVDPFSKEEIESLLKACDFKNEAQTDRRRKFKMRRPTAYRDKAIILTLLDTGLRATELCQLRVGSLDPKTGRILVKHGTAGGAKGGKGRFVYLGKTAKKAVWRYLADREDGEELEAPLFVNKFGKSMNKDSLRQIITDIGHKVNINRTYPHRFRHTFAITYLRSGGDLFTLKTILGHNSLEMVQHYARIAEVDIEEAHRRASPADNWRL